jgi:hypothetical protein
MVYGLFRCPDRRCFHADIFVYFSAGILVFSQATSIGRIMNKWLGLRCPTATIQPSHNGGIITLFSMFR